MLISFLVSDQRLDRREMNAYLREFLPNYMIPDHFVALDQIPLTVAGKVDVPTLQKWKPGQDQPKVDVLAPRNEVEAQIAAIITEVLEYPHIGVRDNIFDLNANSIKSIRIFRKLDALYPDRLNISDIFSYPTIEQLAEFLSGSQDPGPVSSAYTEFEL